MRKAMIDFDGYLLVPEEVICVTPYRLDTTSQHFFVVHFRGGGSTTMTGDRDEFLQKIGHIDVKDTI